MRRTTSAAALLAVAFIGAAGVALDHEPPADETSSMAAPAHSIESLAFLAGSWSADTDGGYTDETWSRPRGNNLVGTFRWLKPDGTPSMFEILAITQEPDAIRLRLRHYTAALVAKEQEDKPITLKLAELKGARVVFKAEKDAGPLDHIVYAVTGDELVITVAFTPPPADKPDAKPRKPLEFRLKKITF